MDHVKKCPLKKLFVFVEKLVFGHYLQVINEIKCYYGFIMVVWLVVVLLWLFQVS